MCSYKMGTTIYAKNLNFHSFRKHFIAWQDPKFFWFLLHNNLFFKNWDEVAIAVLDFIRINGGIWHLWGHSWEIDENNDWNRLENVFCRIGILMKEVRMVDNKELMRICTNAK